MAGRESCRRRAKVRAGLGDVAFEAAFARGAAMETADVRALIAGAEAAKPRAAEIDAGPSIRLTAREQQVADLIADGLGNRQIAGKLVVSTRTADSHVQNILVKLGFTSRAQIASYLAASRQPNSRREGLSSS